MYLVTAAAAAQLLTSCTLAHETTGAVPSTPAGASESLQRPVTAEGPYPVEYVSDGDTITVNIAGTDTVVRMIGIDTPEVKDPRKPVQCYGQEASKQAHELLDGTQVWLEYAPGGSRKDDYGRTLAYVWTDQNTLINRNMIAMGLAHEYTYGGNAYKYQEAFKAAQKAAESAELGLWSPGTCNGDTSGPSQ